MSEFEFTDKCREISGFGGDYEKACRDMVKAGMQWIKDNPGVELVYDGYWANHNQPMQELESHVAKVNYGCTGAMVATTLNHIMFAHKNGWKAYIDQMELKL